MDFTFKIFFLSRSFLWFFKFFFLLFIIFMFSFKSLNIFVIAVLKSLSVNYTIFIILSLFIVTDVSLGNGSHFSAYSLDV